MRLSFLAIALMGAVCSHAQVSELENYLKAHQVNIIATGGELQLGNDASTMLATKMQGKKLFVLSEGNYNLPLNGEAWMMFEQYFSSNGLKYCFMEDGRATCMMVNKQSLPSDIVPANAGADMTETYIMANRAQEHNIAAHASQVQYVGIDYERPLTFYPAIEVLLSDVSEETKAKVYKVSPYLRTKHIKPEVFGSKYAEMQKAFIKDKETLAAIIPDKMNDLQYLMSNQNINYVQNYRDKYMAKNLLEKIGNGEDNGVYMLNCGYYHATPAIKGNMVSRLQNEKVLKDKVMVVNVYCDSCGEDAQGLTERKVLNGKDLDAFRNAAGTDIVLYDLSELPEPYRKLKEHGDMLLFARNYNTSAPAVGSTENN